MIPRTEDPCQIPRWQREFAGAFNRTEELLQYLELDPSSSIGAAEAAQSFSLRVPRGFAARMAKGDPTDPLLLQVLPQGQEMDAVVQTGYSPDPVGDGDAQQLPGLLQKYSGRALLMASPVCAVHCRYCFRRHYPYAEASLSTQGRAEVIQALSSDESLREIILSGGDPLSLSDACLGDLIGALEPLPHMN